MPLSYQELTDTLLDASILGAATFVGMTFPTAIGTAFPESSKVITSPQIKPSGGGSSASTSKQPFWLATASAS